MTDVPEPDATAETQILERPVTESPEPAAPAAAVVAAVPPRTGRRRRRVSRWDRPPEPRDWRWVVGHIGRTLITVGVLMFGFVAYQLWGTGIQTLRAQNDLESDYEHNLEELGITPETIGPPASESVTIPPDTTAVTPATVDNTAGSTPTSETAPVETTPTTLPPETTQPPVPQNYGLVEPSDVLGRIVIPRIDIDFYYVAGVGVKDLRKGVGHFPNTPLPGQVGNAALAGHRTTYAAPFGDLDKLEQGDEIQIYTVLGQAYAYTVTDIFIVNPNDYYVVTDSDPNVATLTLITCTPKTTSKQRLIVRATLDQARTPSPVGLPTPYAEDPGSTDSTELPGEETVPVETAAPATSEAVTSAPVDTSVAGSTVIDSAVATAPGAADTTLPAVGDATTGSGGFETNDAFTQGWFDDDKAWPHVGGWAALLVGVWYGAWRLAKRLRKLWVGILAGFVPFVVVLYFFYENVARLLPAAL